MVMTHAVEIISTLSATFKASASQQIVDAQNEISLSLDMTTKISINSPEGQTQVIARDQSIALIHCLFRLKCKSTEPLYKSAWYTLSLLTYLIFSTCA